MAKVEIEESELAALQQVNKFATTALANPKTRRAMLEVQKTLNPDSVIPEIDAADQVMKVVKTVEDKLDGMMKKFDERQTADNESRVTAQLEAKIAAGQKMLQTRGYNAEGVQQIEALMTAEGIASYAAGLAYFEQLHPPAQPADNSRTSRFGDMSGNDVQTDDFKKLWESQGQSEDWLQESLHKVRSEFRN